MGTARWWPSLSDHRAAYSDVHLYPWISSPEVTPPSLLLLATSGEWMMSACAVIAQHAPRSREDGGPGDRGDRGHLCPDADAPPPLLMRVVVV